MYSSIYVLKTTLKIGFGLPSKKCIIMMETAICISVDSCRYRLDISWRQREKCYGVLLVLLILKQILWFLHSFPSLLTCSQVEKVQKIDG
jgi:hypothetical protein